MDTAILDSNKRRKQQDDLLDTITPSNQSNHKLYQLNNNNIILKSRDFVKVNDLDAFDLKHVLAKTNLVFLQQHQHHQHNNNNNNNNCIGSDVSSAATIADILTATTTAAALATTITTNVATMNTDDITDLRHESLNHILKNNMEIINKHSNTIDLKPIIHLNANNNAIDSIDEDNNNHILMVDNMANTDSNNGPSNKGDNVDDQFSHLIDDEQQHNADQDDDKVSFSLCVYLSF